MNKILPTALIALSSALHASIDSWVIGQDLFKVCGDSNSLCTGFIAGTVSAYDEYYCLEGVTIGSIQGVVFDWLQRHPDRLEESALVLVLDALDEVYTCEEPAVVI